MKNTEKVKRWRMANPEKHKRISKAYYERNREIVLTKNRFYAMKKTAPGRAKLLLSELLGKHYDAIVTRARRGSFKFTNSELKKIRGALCRSWKK